MPGPFPPDESRPEPIGKQPSVGHAALDDDHAKLWALTLAFREESRDHNLPQAMARFESLLTSTQAHFLREELLLSHRDGSRMEAHRREHREILDKMQLISRENFLFLRSWPGLSGDLAYHLIQRSLAHDMTETEAFPAEPLLLFPDPV